MSSKSDYLENKTLDGVLGGPDFVRPATVWIALFTSSPADAAGGTEVVGGAYARVAMTNNATNWPAASGGLKQNGTEVTFPTASASWGTVVAFGIFDASSGGNLLVWGILNTAEYDFVGETGSNQLTAPGHNFAEGEEVRVEIDPPGALPAGLAAGITYFVRTPVADKFFLSSTELGAPITITANGSGLVGLLLSKVFGLGDTARFPIGGLQFSED